MAYQAVNRRALKVDGLKLARGEAQYTDDLEISGLLHAKILASPHAHARIRSINASAARALPGVRAVLTHHDVPRVAHTTAGQSPPEPSPYDRFVLDAKVRYVGDRVAFVAADTPKIASQALDLIRVEYEVLPAVLDFERAMDPGAPIIHDEPDVSGIHDASRNLAAHVEMRVGSVEQGFADSDLVVEGTYYVPQVQQCALEPHVTITWLDEDGTLIVRTSTQVPFHLRRLLAQIFGLPEARIRVIKPRVGGAFGGKQEMVTEDACAALTLATGRPVRLELTRHEEFWGSRSRHAMRVHLKTGVRQDGAIVAQQMTVLSNTGAYGAHGKTVTGNTGKKVLPLYRAEHLRFSYDVVYTNLPVAGAYRGYGAPQGFFPLESHMDVVAEALGMDPVEFRRKNMVRVGDTDPLAPHGGYTQVFRSCGLAECLDRVTAAIGWSEKRSRPGTGRFRRGVGIACAMQGSGVANVDWGAATLKLNEDGSFNLLVGATDLGTGSDTILCQIAAETLGVSTQDIVIYSSDTGMTPFDVGAYASSTTYVSGEAVRRAAAAVRQQLLEMAADLWECPPELIGIEDRTVRGPRGKSMPLRDLAMHALYKVKRQVGATESHCAPESPPPFLAQAAAVEVDMETGAVRVLQMVTAVDLGRAINPALAEGQVEGAMAQSLGYALSEEMVFGPDGRLRNPTFLDYKIMTAEDMPRLETILVETEEPSGPFGAKSVGEVPMNATAPAIANAISDAIGIRFRRLPITAERVFMALHGDADRASNPGA